MIIEGIKKLLAVFLGLLVIGMPILLKTSGVVFDRVIAYDYRGYEELVNRGLLNDAVDTRSAQYQADLPIPIPIVYALPTGDAIFSKFVDAWIQISMPLGVMEQAYQYWILGRETATQQQRWSIIRDVLHWID